MRGRLVSAGALDTTSSGRSRPESRRHFGQRPTGPKPPMTVPHFGQALAEVMTVLFQSDSTTSLTNRYSVLFSTGNDRDHVTQLVVNLLRVRDGIGDFSPQQITKM